MDVAAALQNFPRGQAGHAAVRAELLQNAAGARVAFGVFTAELRHKHGTIGKVKIYIAGRQAFTGGTNILAGAKS